MMTGLANTELNHGPASASYGELLLTFQPRTIHNEYDYNQIQAEIDRLLDKEQLSASEEIYLDLLGTLLSAYEAQTEKLNNYELRGVALIKGLLELQGLQQKDLLPIFKTKSIVSAVLSGKRQLTVDHIAGLADYFHLPHSFFFEKTARAGTGRTH